MGGMWNCVQQRAGDGAHLVDALEPEALFVRGDLEHGVGRGVDDAIAGCDMLIAQLLDNLRARRVAVAEEPRKARAPHEHVRQLCREARGFAGKLALVEFHGDARHLRMSARRVFAGARLAGGAVCADNRAGRPDPR